MNKLDRPYEGHLTLRDFSVPAGGEWRSRLSGWSVMQVAQGTGYYLQSQQNQELEPGSVLLITGVVEANIRASQLGEFSFYAFNVTPARLTGIITLMEQESLKTAASKKDNAVKIFPPASPPAVKMKDIYGAQKRDGLLFRLKLLHLFAEIVGQEFDRSTPEEETTDAKQRLQVFLNEMPSSELLEMNFSELAQRTHCTARHLGRIFHQLVGMSFRDKRAAIRLDRARELLATTDFKIVDVALESGFKSLSLFNLMFARHFGVSPGKWRQRQGTQGENTGTEKPKKTSLGNRQLHSMQIKAPAQSGGNLGKFRGQKSREYDGTSATPKRGARMAMVP
jgi:AraC-like DNA-binding protein